MDLALNNLQWLICHKTKPNQTIPDNEMHKFQLDFGIKKITHWPEVPT